MENVLVLNKFITVINTFTFDGDLIREYVQGQITEIVEFDYKGDVVVFKMNQVDKLEDFVNGKEGVKFTEREFRASKIQPKAIYWEI